MSLDPREYVHLVTRLREEDWAPAYVRLVRACQTYDPAKSKLGVERYLSTVIQYGVLDAVRIEGPMGRRTVSIRKRKNGGGWTRGIWTEHHPDDQGGEWSIVDHMMQKAGVREHRQNRHRGRSDRVDMGYLRRKLGPRKFQALEMIGAGYRQGEIAKWLGVSPSLVSVWVAQARGLLEAREGAQGDRRHRTRAAFTLAELLLVIAILAVLLAFLLPALSGARQCGWAAVCVSNERQLAAAAMHYAADFRDFVPREGFAGGAPLGHPCWPVVLRPYVDPSEPRRDGFAYAPYYRDPGRRVGDAHQVHYVSNGFPFIGAGTVDPRGEGASFRRPATQLYLIERTAAVAYFSDFGDDASGEVQRLIDRWDGWGDEGIAQAYDLWAVRHLDPERLGLRRHYGTGAGVAYFDGHAAVVTAKVVSDTGIWDDGLRR